MLAAASAVTVPEVAVSVIPSALAKTIALTVITADAVSFYSKVLMAGGKSELNQLSQRRGLDQKDNVDKARPEWRKEDPNCSNTNPGDDYPNEDRPWWHPGNWCIGPCDVYAADDEGGGRTRLPGNVRYNVIQRIPVRPTGRLADVVYKNQKMFKNWLSAEQSAKRIGNPLTADEANRVIQQAQKLGIKKQAFDFNKAGLQGMEKTGKWKDIPHFKIGRIHIPIELGFTPPW